MTEEIIDQKPRFELQTIAVLFGLIANLGTMIWWASGTNTNMEHLNESVKLLSSKVESRLDNFEERMRMAEREIAILKVIIDREKKKGR